MKHSLPIKIISVTVAVGIVSGGAAAGWNYYRSGTQFHPQTNSQALRENAVTFPSEDQDMVSQQQGGDDSASRHDPDADSTRQPEQNTSLNQTIQLPGSIDGQADFTLVDPSASGSRTTSDSGYVVTPNGNTALLPNGSGSTGSTLPGSLTPGEGSSDSGSGGTDDGGNSGGGESVSTPTDTVISNESDIPPIPDVRVDPSTLPADPYKENGFNGKDFDTDTGIQPSTQPGASSDTTGNTYSFRVMQRDTFEGLARFYQGEEITAADFFQTSYFHITEYYADGRTPSIYRITDFGENFRISAFPSTMDCNSFEVYFYYRINPDSEWHKYGPVTYQVARCELRLLMNYNYLDDQAANGASNGTAKSENDDPYTSGRPIQFYPEDGTQTYDLSRYFCLMQPEALWNTSASKRTGSRSIEDDDSEAGAGSEPDTPDGDTSEDLEPDVPDSGGDNFDDTWDDSEEDTPIEMTQLFIGWSETPLGGLVGNTYTVSADATGLIQLYPAPMVDLPEGYTAEVDYEITPLLSGYQTDQYHTLCYQVITSVPNGSYDWDTGVSTYPDLDLPFGAQVLSTYYTQGASLNIPSTLLKINDLDSLQINSSISVEEGNPCFNADDNILYNADRTAILSVPTDLQELTVPADVTSLTLPSNSNIFTMTFLGTTPPEMDLSTFSYTTAYYVPAEAEIPYFVRLYSKLDEESGIVMYTVAEDGTTTQCTLQVENDMVLSADHKTLLAILPSISGTCVLPSTIETIASGALDFADAVTTLVIPDSVTTIEAESLNGSALSRVLFAGDVPPILADDAVPDGVTLCVSPESYDAYVKSWGSRVTITPLQFTLYDKDEWRFLTETDAENNSTLTLLNVPADLTEFSPDTMSALTDGAAITAIGDYAFSDAAQLKSVILPDSLEKVGKYAFLGCTSLEFIYSQRTDPMTLDPTAFYVDQTSWNTCSMRFICLHSMEVDFGDNPNYRYYPFYVPDDAVGYPSSVHMYGPGYTLFDNPDGGRFLFSAPREHDSSDGFNGTYGSFLLAATTDIAGTVTLPDDTIRIGDSAFRNCSNPFTLTNLDRLFWIGSYSFASSGISLTALPCVEIIQESAFSQCENMTALDLSECEYLALIDDNAFSYSGLSAITFGENAYDGESESYVTNLQLGYYAFGYSKLTELTVPAYVNTIGVDIVTGCDMEEITLLCKSVPTLFYFYGTQGALRSIQNPDDSSSTIADPNFRVYLAGDAVGQELEYVKEWREPMSPRFASTDEEYLEGENTVRRMFGLPEVTELTNFDTESALSEDGGPEVESILDESAQSSSAPSPDDAAPTAPAEDASTPPERSDAEAPAEDTLPAPADDPAQSDLSSAPEEADPDSSSEPKLDAASGSADQAEPEEGGTA